VAPAGEAIATILATFEQFKRRLIGQRTREALANEGYKPLRGGDWHRAHFNASSRAQSPPDEHHSPSDW
jgi:DNA invertase Pin-like site-specific DNA recombinase